MDNTADAGGARQGRRHRMRKTLPKIGVSTRGELAMVLHTWRWLLEERAVKALGDTDAAQEAVRRTTLKMLAIEQPDSAHALRWMLMTLRDECKAVERRRRRIEAATERARQAGAPVDRFLGPLTGATAEAVRILPPEERDVLTLAAEGLRPSEIGALLGVSTKTVSQRLWRGRRKVRAALADGKEGPSPAGLALPTLVEGHRLLTRFGSRTTRAVRMSATTPRAIASRLGALLGHVDVSQITAATAVLAVVGTLGSGPPTVQSAPGPLATRVQLTRADVTLEATHASQQTSEPGKTPDTKVSARDHGPLSLLLPRSVGASTETPDDTQLVSAEPAPSEGGHGIVVALGVGHACGCRALFQSLDAGRTWLATAGPPSGEQVALPPDYPRDPRIFIGTDRASGAAVSVAAHFGAPFHAINELLPPGHVTLSAGFDSGDPRLFVAGASGVVSYAIGSTAPVPVVAYSPLDAPAALATPPADADAAVFLAAPATAQIVGVPSGLSPSVPTGFPRLVSCGRLTACSVVASIPLANVAALDVAGGPSQPTVIVSGVGGLARSTDGGLHFEAVSVPAESALVSTALYGQVTWAITVQGSRLHLGRLGAGGGWTDITDGSVLQGEGDMVALSPLRLLYLPVGQGFFCSENGGVSWARGCL